MKIRVRTRIFPFQWGKYEAARRHIPPGRLISIQLPTSGAWLGDWKAIDAPLGTVDLVRLADAGDGDV